MKFNFPKIVHEINLGEYDPAWSGQVFDIWVNPPAKDLVAMADLYKAHSDKTKVPEAIESVKRHLASIEKPTAEQKKEHEKMLKFYADRLAEINGPEFVDAYDKYLELLSSILSQGTEEDRRVSVDDLKGIEKATQETDPAFWIWFQNRVMDEVSNHRLGQKKD